MAVIANGRTTHSRWSQQKKGALCWLHILGNAGSLSRALGIGFELAMHYHQHGKEKKECLGYCPLGVELKKVRTFGLIFKGIFNAVQIVLHLWNMTPLYAELFQRRDRLLNVDILSSNNKVFTPLQNFVIVYRRDIFYIASKNEVDKSFWTSKLFTGSRNL